MPEEVIVAENELDAERLENGAALSVNLYLNGVVPAHDAIWDFLGGDIDWDTATYNSGAGVWNATFSFAQKVHTDLYHAATGSFDASTEAVVQYIGEFGGDHIYLASFQSGTIFKENDGTPHPVLSGQMYFASAVSMEDVVLNPPPYTQAIDILNTNPLGAETSFLIYE